MTVCVKLRRFKFVAFKVKDRFNNFLIVSVVCALNHFRARLCVFPRSGNFYFNKVIARRRVYSVVVHLNDCVALSAKRLFSHILHKLYSFVVGHNLGINAEESRLQNGVGSAFKSKFRRNFYSVDNVKINILSCNILFNLRRKELFKLLNRGSVGIDKESAAFFNIARHIVAGDIRGVGALNEVRAVYKVFRLNGRVAETEVGNGDAARLFRVVEEIRLRVLVRMVAYNFNGVFVCAYRTVRTKSVEFTAGRPCGCGVKLNREIKRGIGYVLVNTYGEMVFRLFLFKVFINSKHHRGGKLFRAESVSAAYDLYVFNALFHKRGANVKVQRFAKRAGLFRSVKYGNSLCGSGKRRNKRVRNEGAVKAYFYKTVFFTGSVKFVYGFFNGFATRTHTNYNLVRVGCANVVEQVVFSAAFSGNDVHHFLNYSGSGSVVAVCGFPVLEIGVAVLRGTFLNGVFGVERARLKVCNIGFNSRFGANFADFRIVVRIVPNVYFSYFVAGSETVEEIDERHSRL